MKLLSLRHPMVPAAPASVEFQPSVVDPPVEIRPLLTVPEPTEVKPLSPEKCLECLNAYLGRIGTAEPTSTDQEVIRGLEEAYKRALAGDLGETAVSA